MAQFDITKVPEEDLVAFYGLLYSSAATDGKISKDELKRIFQTIHLDALSEKNKDIVHEFLFHPPSIEECLEKLSKSEGAMKYAVVVNITEIAYADAHINKDEAIFLTNVCDKLGITEKQKQAILHYVKISDEMIKRGKDDEVAKKIMKEAAAGLGAVGVPLAAVYLSGSIIGLSAAGISGGLAALGLGLGMVPGIGVVVLLSVLAYKSCKMLFGNGNRAKEETAAALAKRYAANMERAMDTVLRVLQAERIENTDPDKVKDLQERVEILRALRGE